jgi:cell division protein FtsA
MGRTGVMHEIHGGVHLVGGGALLTHLPILAQTLLGRPRVVLGRIQGVVGLPQATGNPFFVNALGAVKALSRDMNETRGKQDRGDGFLGRFKKLF